MSVRRWVTKSLRPGDLTALAEISRGRSNDPEANRIERLNRRGFVKRKHDLFVATLRGRAALFLRRLTKH